MTEGPQKSAPRLFDANGMDWRPHPSFPAILTKSLETRATHPAASVTLVQVGPGGVIETHIHQQETETAYVLAGRGRLLVDETEQLIGAGSGVTIPPGIAHSLHNAGAAPLQLLAVHTPPVF